MYDEEMQRECTTVGQYLRRTIIYCVLIAVVDYKWLYLYPETIRTQLKWFIIARLICLPFRNIIEYETDRTTQRRTVLGPWYVNIMFVIAIIAQVFCGGKIDENNPKNHELCTITKAYLEEYVANNPEITITKSNTYLLTDIGYIKYKGWLKSNKENPKETWVVYSYDAEINEEYVSNILCRVSTDGKIEMGEYFEVYEQCKEKHDKKIFKRKDSEFRLADVEEKQYLKYINSIDKKQKYKKKYYIDKDMTLDST